MYACAAPIALSSGQDGAGNSASWTVPSYGLERVRESSCLFKNITPDIFGPMWCEGGEKKGLSFDKPEDQITMHISTGHITIPTPCVLIIEQTSLECRFVPRSIKIGGGLYNERIHLVFKSSVEEGIFSRSHL